MKELNLEEMENVEGGSFQYGIGGCPIGLGVFGISSWFACTFL